MSEQTYTLDEAQRELQRRECAWSGHGPDRVVQNGFGVAVMAYCDCGTVTWRPDKVAPYRVAE